LLMAKVPASRSWCKWRRQPARDKQMCISRYICQLPPPSWWRWRCFSPWSSAPHNSSHGGRRPSPAPAAQRGRSCGMPSWTRRHRRVPLQGHADRRLTRLGRAGMAVGSGSMETCREGA